MAATPIPEGNRNTQRISTTGDRVGDAQQQIQKPWQPVFIDLVTLDKLYFQTIPLELEYDPHPNFVALPSISRNSPFFQYTGSEDTLSFTLSWYSNDQTREDVLKKVKWLEALTKADGYVRGPHPVLLLFGDMFKDATWYVVSAKPRFQLFNREANMLPELAYQDIVMKKILDRNSTRSDILNLHT